MGRLDYYNRRWFEYIGVPDGAVRQMLLLIGHSTFILTTLIASLRHGRYH